ncbi:Iron transport multicopper oxidase FET3 [Cladobotryum mycophilum]|uniref:Iron transport multicopper oxidase FET3 n=1 Tax=Cladobotryum mycophilum TaxID=491253 RepID=A0ABR0SEB6_9HYPO
MGHYHDDRFNYSNEETSQSTLVSNMDGDRHTVDEDREPFIQPASHSGSSPQQPRNGRPHARSLWNLSLFFFVVLSLILLSSVTLGGLQVPSRASPSTAPEHADEGHGSDSSLGDEKEHHDSQPNADGKGSSIPVIFQHGDKVPNVPTLRDVSQYILDPFWDVNASPTTRIYNWTILDGRLNPDGIYRPMILINNQFPGPLVECNAGDTIVVNVENRGVNATSIHFHGLFQNGTNAMDGAVGITQCPIAPNSTFTYRFQVKDQLGTFYYHAHHSSQTSDGLVGPVVVHRKDERTLQKLEYASDRVVMVQDHYHNLTSELLMEYLKPGIENREPVPDNGLINGRGVRGCDEFAGWECDTTNVSTPVFDLAAGKRHRLRIINVGAFAEFQIQFDQHPFYVTEVDGIDVHPEPFHRLNILPAQRYSIILETNATTTDSFWMRARMVTHCFGSRNPLLQPEMRSIIRYTSPNSKASDKEPDSREWPDPIEVICRDLNVSSLHPVISMNPPPADEFITLRTNFKIGDWRLARAFFNDSTWHHNTGKELVLQTEGIRVIDISINNFDDGDHPFHLHGHSFFVLVNGQSGYPPSAADFPAYAQEHGLLENPVRRDTVTVEGYGWAIIRVVLDNPGIWAFHCHIMWHAESGMVMQMLVRSDVVRTWHVDPGERAMCQLEGVEKGDDLMIASGLVSLISKI